MESLSREPLIKEIRDLKKKVVDLDNQLDALRNEAADWRGLYHQIRDVVAGECAFLAERVFTGEQAAEQIRDVFHLEGKPGERALVLRTIKEVYDLVQNPIDKAKIGAKYQLFEGQHGK